MANGLTETGVAAEWAEHEAVWTAFPHDPAAWFDALADAQIEVAGMIQALSDGDRVKVLVADETTRQRAESLLVMNDNVELIVADYGDSWLRDTGPVFARDGTALRFRTNGWGGKYIYPHDDTVGDDVATLSGKPIARFSFVLEGGAVDTDGEGTLLTTAQCVLNANRNPGWSKEVAEKELCAAYGAEKVIWIDEGLLNDHTDGHVDNIARFIAPGHVVVMAANGEDDPNAEIYARIHATLAAATDARGRALQVSTIPSPGRINGEDGEAVPASHLNFIIGNKAVIVPVYSAEIGAAAVQALTGLFPHHRVIGLPSNAILTGGGSFHCITQQEPK